MCKNGGLCGAGCRVERLEGGWGSGAGACLRRDSQMYQGRCFP